MPPVIAPRHRPRPSSPSLRIFVAGRTQGLARFSPPASLPPAAPPRHDLLVMCLQPDLLPPLAHVAPPAGEALLDHRVLVLAF